MIEIKTPQEQRFICMNQSKLVSKAMHNSFSGIVNTERQNIKSR